MGESLWRSYAYQPGEADRVVLCVELECVEGDSRVWHQSGSLDARGNARGSAMARLVSLTVSLAIESVLDGAIEPGVSAAPGDPALVNQWLERLSALGEPVFRRDHLAV